MSIYKRGGVWWMDVYVGSGNRRKRVRKSTGCTEEVQARMVEQTMVAVNKGLTSRQRAQNILDNILPKEERGVAVGDCRAFYEDCMAREGVTLSKLELQKRLNVISRMAEWVLANTRAKWVHEVTAEIAWAYSCAIGKRDVTVKTRNNEIGHLRTVWKMLEKHGKVEDNPWGLVRAQRDRSKGDIEHLKWEGDPEKEVVADMNTRRIYGTPSKTARKRVRVDIPMHEKVYDLLNKMERREYIFPWRLSHPNGQRPQKGDFFFSEVLKRAGIVAGKGEKVSFHSLRHTFVTRLADAGVAEDVRMRLAGHTNAITHGVYTHEDSQSKAAIEALQ